MTSLPAWPTDARRLATVSKTSKRLAFMIVLVLDKHEPPPGSIGASSELVMFSFLRESLAVRNHTVFRFFNRPESWKVPLPLGVSHPNSGRYFLPLLPTFQENYTYYAYRIIVTVNLFLLDHRAPFSSATAITSITHFLSRWLNCKLISRYIHTRRKSHTIAREEVPTDSYARHCKLQSCSSMY